MVISYDRLHHFIASGVWDEEPLQAALLAEADKQVGGDGAWLIIDDTALPKKGRHSVGVASQYASGCCQSNGVEPIRDALVLCFCFQFSQQTKVSRDHPRPSASQQPAPMIARPIALTTPSNRIFTSHDNIVDQCCEAWNKLVDQPWHIMTIGRRKWARGS